MTGSGTATLRFDYTVASGDTSADLATNAVAPQIDRGSATLTDAAGNPVGLSVAAGTALATNRNLVVDTAAPAAFTIAAPLAAAVVTDDTPTVTWTDPGDADTFDLRVDDAGGCLTPEQTITGVVGTSVTLARLAAGAHFVCVTARDAAGNATSAANDNLTFTVDTGTWSALESSGAPSARRGAKAVWDDVNGRVLIWGGVDAGGVPLGTGAALAPTSNAWAAIDASDVDRPSGRRDFSATWASDRLVIWGGDDGGGVTATGARYRPGAGDPWEAMATGSAPSARKRHTAVWNAVSARLLVFGGHDGTGVVDTGAAYDPAGDAWTPLDASEPDRASARQRHTAVWTGTMMLIWGGDDGTTTLNTGARYDPAGGIGAKWSPVATNGAPAARHDHVAFWDTNAGVMVVYGGFGTGGVARGDGGRYDPLLDLWSPLSATDAPTARGAPLAAWDGTEHRLVVFGGAASGVALDSGAVYRTGGDVWTVPEVTGVGAPTARYDAAVAWTGTRLVVFGGFDGVAVLGGGGMLRVP